MDDRVCYQLICSFIFDIPPLYFMPMLEINPIEFHLKKGFFAIISTQVGKMLTIVGIMQLEIKY